MLGAADAPRVMSCSHATLCGTTRNCGSLASAGSDMSKVLEAITESFRKRVLTMDLANLTTRGLSGTPRHMLLSSNRHCTMQVSRMPLTLELAGSGLRRSWAHALASALVAPLRCSRTEARWLRTCSGLSQHILAYSCATVMIGIRFSMSSASRLRKSERNLSWNRLNSDAFDGVARKARRGAMASKERHAKV